MRTRGRVLAVLLLVALAGRAIAAPAEYVLELIPDESDPLNDAVLVIPVEEQRTEEDAVDILLSGLLESTDTDRGGETIIMRTLVPAASTEDDEDEGFAFRPSPGAPRQLAIMRRALKSVEESEALTEETDDEGLAGERRRRSVLSVVMKRGAEQQGDTERAGEATPAPPPPGGFLETIQGQLPGQLQGLGGAMENSEMVVGTFQAVIMPGSAATDLGQQIQGFISNMPQLPQLPAGAGAGG